MWNGKRSMMLSKVCTLICLAFVVVVLVTGPRLVLWLMGISNNAQMADSRLFMATLYVGGVAAVALLLLLYRLLHNIGLGQVFVPSNVALMRYLSWGCFAGGAVGLVSALYYLPWGLVGLAACFVGLILRVVKNVFAQAVELKNENDYTV